MAGAGRRGLSVAASVAASVALLTIISVTVLLTIADRELLGLWVQVAECDRLTLLLGPLEDVQSLGDVGLVDEVVVPIRRPNSADLASEPAAERTAGGGIGGGSE